VTDRSRQGVEALRQRDFGLYWCARVVAVLATEMQSTAVGWHIYRLTGRELDLGLVGLAQFAPFALLFLITGLVADRFSRVRILAICVGAQSACAIAFFAMTHAGAANSTWILTILVAFGISRAFQAPVQQSIVPNLVPQRLVANAIAWMSSGHQIARIAGPTIAGLTIALGEGGEDGEVPVYGAVAVLLCLSMLLTVLIRGRAQVLSREPVTLRTLMAGMRFIWTRQVIFAAVVLDLFAVLFGGATALLPIYAKDILHVGSEGFGLLRSALMVGAFVGALILTQRAVPRPAGITLPITVGLFGAGVVVFGASETFWLSLVALFVMGAADVVSVFIRHNLVQLIVPDEMRGRVGAVVGVFVGASNELGDFRAGVTAYWWGTVPAVVAGGAVTLFVAASCLCVFPVLRRVDSLDPDALIRRFREPHGRSDASDR
jgi:MFS family permease